MITRAQKIAAIKACVDAAGRISPEAVIKAARNKNNPLHDAFEWDDKKAAHSFRIETARALIRSIEFEVTRGTVTTVAPCYVKDNSVKTSGYIEAARVAKSRENSKRTLLDELARIKGAINRAMDLAELFDLTAYFEHMLALVTSVESDERLMDAAE